MVKSYQHSEAKYKGLNPQNQTPKNYVVGQRYKVGTGIALIQTSPGETRKIDFPRCSYKKFLSFILRHQTNLGNILGLKWIPKKLVKEKTIRSQMDSQLCESPCVRGGGCVRPGCICNEEKEICE